MRLTASAKGGAALRRRLACLAAAGALAFPPGPAAAGSPDAAMADVVARLLPSVVCISIARPARPPQGGMRQAGADDGAVSPANARRTLGSGFIIDPDGTILTNKHVVDAATQLTVTLQDGSSFHARVIGEGISTDIAVIKIEAMRPLPPVVFGDSDAMRPGDAVLAIGNPLGFGGSVSAGIVSAVGRDIGDGSPLDDFIQTDAAINHGNSGGPLFNARGEVIGMSTALFSPNPAGGSIGLGFAIAGNDVRFVEGQLRRYGRVHAGWIGARLQHLTPGLADAAHLTEPATGIVAALDPDGPAAKAGMRLGDVVIGPEGGQPQTARQFTIGLAALEPGTPSVVTVWRDGRRMEIPLTVEEWPPMRGTTDSPAAAMSVNMAAPGFGLTLGKSEPDGVAIEAIDPSSAAATTGMSSGDVIRQVNLTPAKDAETVLDTLAKARAGGDRHAMLLVENGDGPSWIALALGR